MTRQIAEDIGGGIICVAAIAAMAAENPWSLLILALCILS